MGTARLYTVVKVAELLSIHPNGVFALIADGKLNSVTQTIRGKGKRPRRFVAASEVDRYIDALATGIEPEQEKPARRSRAVRQAMVGMVEYIK